MEDYNRLFRKMYPQVGAVLDELKLRVSDMRIPGTAAAASMLVERPTVTLEGHHMILEALVRKLEHQREIVYAFRDLQEKCFQDNLWDLPVLNLEGSSIDEEFEMQLSKMRSKDPFRYVFSLPSGEHGILKRVEPRIGARGVRKWVIHKVDFLDTFDLRKLCDDDDSSDEDNKDHKEGKRKKSPNSLLFLTGTAIRDSMDHLAIVIGYIAVSLLRAVRRSVSSRSNTTAYVMASKRVCK